MENRSRTLTRRELYDLAWSKPMQKLAEELGLSGPGLAKICRRHRVPVPPRGYWAKLAAGRQAAQTRFHEVDDTELNKIVVTRTLHRLGPAARRATRELEAKRGNLPPRDVGTAIGLEVLGHVERPHRLLAVTAKALRRGKSDKLLERRATGAGCCGVIVHRERTERAIAILDCLVRGLLEKGYSVEPAETRLLIKLDKDDVGLTLSERTRRV